MLKQHTHSAHPFSKLCEEEYHLSNIEKTFQLRTFNNMYNLSTEIGLLKEKKKKKGKIGVADKILEEKKKKKIIKN